MKRGPHLAQDTLEPGLSQAPINSSDISCRAIENRIQPRHFMGTKPTSRTTTGISWDIIILDTLIWDFSKCRTPYYHHWFPGEKLPPILRSPQMLQWPIPLRNDLGEYLIEMRVQVSNHQYHSSGLTSKRRCHLKIPCNNNFVLPGRLIPLHQNCRKRIYEGALHHQRSSSRKWQMLVLAFGLGPSTSGVWGIWTKQIGFEYPKYPQLPLYSQIIYIYRVDLYIIYSPTITQRFKVSPRKTSMCRRCHVGHVKPPFVVGVIRYPSGNQILQQNGPCYVCLEWPLWLWGKSLTNSS